MARTFNGSTSTFLQYSGAVLSGGPMTFSAWVLTTNDDQGQSALCITNTASDTNFFDMDVFTQLSPERARARSVVVNTNSISEYTHTFSLNTWYHLLATFDSSSRADVYLNGNKGTRTFDDTPSPSGLNRTSIGGLRRLNPAAAFDGRIADAAIWNVVLSTSQIDALMNRASPFDVQHANLKAYWALPGTGSPEPDYVDTYNMTLNGSVGQGDHAPLPHRFGHDVAPPLAAAADIILNAAVAVLDTYTPTALLRLWTTGTWSYNIGKTGLLNGQIDLDTDTIKVLLVDGSYIFNPDHNYVNQLSANELSGTGYSRKALTITVTKDDANDEADVDAPDVDWTGIDAGEIGSVIVFKDTGDDSTSPLIAQMVPTGFPIITDGSDETLNFHASGLFSLTE